MKKVTKNKLAMYKAVKSVIETHSSEWSGLTAFNTVFNVYKEKLSLLEDKAYNQNLALVGVSALKDAKREMVAERAYAIKSSLSAFAVISNKPDLIDQMKISRWDLLKGQRDRMIQHIDLIIAKATAHLSELADFGVEQATIDQLQALRDELEVQFGAPRNAIVERKVLTQQLKTVTLEIDNILKLQLDELMEVLRVDHPKFFAAYKGARIIVDHRNKQSGNTPQPPERDDGFRPPHFGKDTDGEV